MKEDKLDDITIFLSCGILRDYQKEIKLKFHTEDRQMHVNTEELLFVADENQRKSGSLLLKYEPEICKVVLQNLTKKPLSYTIRTNSIFFDINIVKMGSALQNEVPSGSTDEIIVKPRLQHILESKNLVLSLYLEEHFTIYNNAFPSEKIWVAMRFTRGHLKLFYQNPGSKDGYVYRRLEEQIIKFLSQFSMYFDAQLMTDVVDNSREDLTEYLYLDFRYITDELVFYGLKGHVGETFFDLSRLLHGSLFKHPVFAFWKKIIALFLKSSLGN